MFNSSTRIPIKNPTDPGRIKRHHTACYYAHWVKDNLTTWVSKIICTIFLGLLFIIGLITFVWLSLHPHRPRFHIREFSVPGLGQDTRFENAQISFNALGRNSNDNIGIYYDAVDRAVYYWDQQIRSIPSLLHSFYQAPKNTTMVEGVFSGATLNVSSQRWMEFQNDQAHGTVVFRLELTSRIRFKIWTRKGHRMHANCDVSVGPDGSILPTSKDKRCPVHFA